MMQKQQRGGTLLGLGIGVVIGLGAALAVAVYVTKVPVPFVNKSPPRKADQDAAEALKNKDWDPNVQLQNKGGRNPASAASGGPATGTATSPARPPDSSVRAATSPGSAPVPLAAWADPLGDLAKSRDVAPARVATAAPTAAATGIDPFSYFVQAGAFRTQGDAEAMRARLTLLGVDAKVTEREQAGRVVYRVRAGPFEQKEPADRMKEKLEGNGLEAALVRVQR